MRVKQKYLSVYQIMKCKISKYNNDTLINYSEGNTNPFTFISLHTIYYFVLLISIFLWKCKHFYIGYLP